MLIPIKHHPLDISSPTSSSNRDPGVSELGNEQRFGVALGEVGGEAFGGEELEGEVGC